MLEHKKIRSLDDYFVDLNGRQSREVYFYRINGYTEKIGDFIKKYYDTARRAGVAVSYTHLDVYKRQVQWANSIRQRHSLPVLWLGYQ